jgi:preprotein translocase subunit SecG
MIVVVILVVVVVVVLVDGSGGGGATTPGQSISPAKKVTARTSVRIVAAHAWRKVFM